MGLTQKMREAWRGYSPSPVQLHTGPLSAIAWGQGLLPTVTPPEIGAQLTRGSGLITRANAQGVGANSTLLFPAADFPNRAVTVHVRLAALSRGFVAAGSTGSVRGGAVRGAAINGQGEHQQSDIF